MNQLHTDVGTDRREVRKKSGVYVFLWLGGNIGSFDLGCYLDDILTLLDPASLIAIPDSETPPTLYVLTNSDKLFGASVILYPHLLESIAKRMDCDFIILPSSIHEVLLIPDSSENKSLHYDAIIQEVNLTQLSPEEILSDHAYYYQRNSDSITDYKVSHTHSPKPSMNNHTS